ncbi:MAG: RluA family pseudouridine synthase [Candidatus Cloacimonetes bacterium]|nr:RluA family pseudouridine synthase [Candidatus Cloacimonadota bacterium]
MEIIETHIVPEGIKEIRLTDYLLRGGIDLFGAEPSRNYVKKVIKNGDVLVNGKRAETATWIESGQKIELLSSAQKPVKIYPLKFDVIYEDDHLAVINKPAGLPVSGNRFRTIENALLNNISLSLADDALMQPRAVHRLDALTAGLLIIAKTRSVRIKLGEKFASREVSKTYRAIVIGETPEKGTISTPVNDQAAVTEYVTIKRVPSLKCQWLSLLELKPQTGRTHQLRIHLAERGFPILGDKLYGNEDTLFKSKGLFLASTGLTFNHPITGMLIGLQIEEPGKFHLHLEREERRYGKFKDLSLRKF